MHTNLQSAVRRRQQGCRFLPLLVALAWPLAACSCAQAQQPDGDFEGEHSYKAPDGKVVQLTDSKVAKQKIGGILRAGKAATAEEEKHFTDFFRYRLAEMTWKENITSLPDMRKNLKNYLGQAGRGAAPDLHVRLNKWILDDFQKIAKDARYPRAIRLNCILTISELDQREAPLGGKPPAVPLAEAEPVLFEFFNDEAQHGALRIAAIRGLMRHAEGTLPADQRSELLAATLKLIKSKEPAKGKSAVGQVWMRVLACGMLQILAGNGADANQAESVGAIEAMVADKSAELWLRSYGSSIFGSLQAKAFPPEKVMPISQQLADLIVEVAKTNDRLLADAGLNAQKKAKTPAPPKPMPPAGNNENGEEEEAEDDRPAIPESLLKVAADDVTADLLYIRFGLTGADLSSRAPQSSSTHALYSAGDQAAKAFINELTTHIDDMLKKLKDPKKELHEQLADVAADAGELQNWLKQQGVSGEQKPEKVVAPGSAKPAGKPAPGTAASRPSGNSGAAESVVNP